MSDYYRLDGHEAVPCDLSAWAMTMQSAAGRRVASTIIGESRVSTVFLGLDHSFGEGPPLLFETLVFGGPLADEMDRCTTWEQAEAMHEAMCKRVRDATPAKPQSDPEPDPGK